MILEEQYRHLRQILDNAEELFLPQEVKATSVLQIAPRLGMSSTNIFRHFANRGALIDVMGERYFPSLEERLCERPKPRKAVDQLRVLARAILQEHLRGLEKPPAP